MSQSNSNIKSYLHLHFLVFLWGFTAILGKLISVPSMEIVFYRTTLAFIFLYGIIKTRDLKLHLARRDFFKIFGTGLIIAIHWTLFFLAVELSNVSICLSGIATVSLWTSILEPIVMKRKIKLYEPLLGILAIVGISVVFKSAFDQYLGFITAVGSAFLASVFTVINGRLVKKNDHYVISFYQMIGASLTMALLITFYSFLGRQSSLMLAFNASDLFYLIVLSLVCTVYAYSSSIKLMHKLSAFAITLTVNLEPVYGIIIAVVLFSETEQMDTSFYWGTAIILASVLLYPLLSHLDKRQELKNSRT